MNKNISYSARAKKGSKRNPFMKQGDLISVKNSLLGKSTAVIREFTAPFVGIYSTKEMIESFNDWLTIKKDPKKKKKKSGHTLKEKENNILLKQ